MWNRLKRWVSSEPPDRALPQADLQWLEPGSGNPFGIRLLDCRPITWNLIPTTGDLQIAARYTALRSSDGRDLVGHPIQNSVRLTTSLALPHNGAPLEGVASKADAMEVKWDIYIYDSVFLFARSWTGELRYRAFAVVGHTDIRILEIDCSADDAALAAPTVYFLLATHAMSRVLPHQIPRELASEDPETIAMWSFAQFGRFGCYATTADITAIPLT